MVCALIAHQSFTWVLDNISPHNYCHTYRMSCSDFHVSFDMYLSSRDLKSRFWNQQDIPDIFYQPFLYILAGLLDILLSVFFSASLLVWAGNSYSFYYFVNYLYCPLWKDLIEWMCDSWYSYQIPALLNCWITHPNIILLGLY